MANLQKLRFLLIVHRIYKIWLSRIFSVPKSQELSHIGSCGTLAAVKYLLRKSIP